MPELPEVAHAAAVLERAALGRTITGLRLFHAALRRRVAPAELRRLRGRRVERVERRGKHQLLVLDDGSALHVHFRMSGDWLIACAADPPARFARAALDLDDGSRVTLVDPRALATMAVHRDGSAALPSLGPEPHDPSLGAAYLRAALAGRRGAIKPELLDQRVVAGLGNIYVAEALWLARISPWAAARSLSTARLERLIAAMRDTIERARAEPGRYGSESGQPMAVYDREGSPCPRCGAKVRRATQAGRSTYYCSRCQRR